MSNINAGLVALWKLDEFSGTRYDSGLNSLDLTEFQLNSHGVEWVDGVINRAADFKFYGVTSGGYLQHAAHPKLIFGNSDWAFFAWDKKTSVYGSAIATFGANTGTSLNISRAAPDYELKVDYYNNSLSQEFIFSHSDDLDVDEWYFLGIWYESATRTVYLQVNETEPQSDVIPFAVEPTNGLFQLGIFGTTTNYGGQLDQVRIYDRIPTAEERHQLFIERAVNHTRTKNPEPENSCPTCIPTPDCAGLETDLLDYYSLDGPIFAFQFNCPAGFTCDSNTFTLLCCDRLVAVTLPPTATIAQKNAILNSIVRECVRIITACGGIPPIIPPPPGVPPPPGSPPPPPVIQFYYNSRQTCVIACPQGGTFSFTEPAGRFVSISQAAADQAALAYACQQAKLERICLLPLIATTCAGSAASFKIKAQGLLAVFPQANFWSLVSGSVPTGMTFEGGFTNNNYVIIDGTPTTPGTYTFTVRVEVAPTGKYQERTYTVTVVGVETSSLPPVAAGDSYSQTLTASGMTGALVWAVTAGALPVGLELNDLTGEISGTAEESGTFNFTVTITDEAGRSCQREYTLTVTCPTILPSSPLTAGTESTPYSATFSAPTVGVPISWVVVSGTLPPGLTLNAATGVLSGTPTTAGNYSFTIGFNFL